MNIAFELNRIVAHLNGLLTKINTLRELQPLSGEDAGMSPPVVPPIPTNGIRGTAGATHATG